MGWKAKEKELSPEEAMKLAKKALEPYWYGALPLLAGVEGPKGVSAIPLEPIFNDKQAWVAVFADPTTLTGAQATQFLKEMHRRYALLELKFLAVFSARYGFLKTSRSFLSTHQEDEQLPCPRVVDADGLLARALGVESTPAMVVMDSAGVHSLAQGEMWVQEAEPGIQRFLRTFDPGLPLLPAITPAALPPMDINVIDFGRGRSFEWPASVKGKRPEKPAGNTLEMFDFGPNGVEPLIRNWPTDQLPMGLKFKGKWIQDGDRLATTDRDAQVSFVSPEPDVYVVMESFSKGMEASRMHVDLMTVSVPDIFAGQHLAFVDDGQSVVKAAGPRLYSVLRSLPSKEREITFRFPALDSKGMALYGFRLGRSR